MKNKSITKIAAVIVATASAVYADDDYNSARQRVLRAAADSAASLQTVLAGGVNVNVTDNDGETALMEAADNGNLHAVKNLIAAGANVNARDEDGETALMVAADEGNLAIIKVLIAAGADVNARDNEGETALYKATDERNRAAADAIRAAGGQR